MGLAGSALLAGCSGGNQSSNQNGGSSGGTESSGSAGSNTAQSTAQADGETRFSGITVDFQESAFRDTGRFAKQVVEAWVRQWEAETGGKVNFTTSTDQEVITRFKNNQQPHLYTDDAPVISQFLPSDLIRPFSSYQDNFPNYLSSEDGGLLSPVQDASKFVWKGYGDQYMVTLISKPYAPILGNMDHYEQTPGLDPEEDFPPENFDHLIETAKKLEEDGPAEHGYQPVGSPGDMVDTQFNQWTAAADAVAGGTGGYNFADSWGDISWDNETWKEWMPKYVKTHTEHGFGTPGTPTISQEATVPMMTNGQLSLSYHTSSTNSIFLNRASKMLKSGTLKWGKPWSGKNNIMANLIMQGAAFPKAPKGKDQANWEKSQAAAADMVQYLMDPENRFMTEEIPVSVGTVPAWGGTLNAIPENDRTTAGNWLPTVRSMLEDSDKLYSYAAHPMHQTIQYEILPKHMQKAWKGNVAPEKALSDAAAEAQSKLDSASGEWKQ